MKEQSRPYLFAFLAFCVFSSKNIIIYNEETAVAATFLAFVGFFYYYFGKNIQSDLNEINWGIKSELQNYGSVKQDSLSAVLVEYQRILHLNVRLKSIGFFTTRELAQAIGRGENASTRMFSEQMGPKLKTLSKSKKTEYTDLLPNLLQWIQLDQEENELFQSNDEFY